MVKYCQLWSDMAEIGPKIAIIGQNSRYWPKMVEFGQNCPIFLGGSHGLSPEGREGQS